MSDIIYPLVQLFNISNLTKNLNLNFPKYFI